MLISVNMADFKMITSNYLRLNQMPTSPISGVMFDFYDKRIESY